MPDPLGRGPHRLESSVRPGDVRLLLGNLGFSHGAGTSLGQTIVDWAARERIPVPAAMANADFGDVSSLDGSAGLVAC